MKKLQFEIAGTPFGSFEEIKNQIKPGASVSLVDEPENPHDSYAVRIEYCGFHLGYVPGKFNYELPVLQNKRFVVVKVTDDSVEVVEQ